MPDWDILVGQRFALLDEINRMYKRFHSLRGVKRISITPFESHYAEYLVAKRLIDSGFVVQGMYEKGCDIRCNEIKIEVKSGRLQKHVKGIKHDFWSWVVPAKQWQSPVRFEFLACVALDYEGQDRIVMMMPYEDVMANFTKGSWKYKNYNVLVKDYLRLNLVKDGYEALLQNTDVMRRECDFKGELSAFEKDLNKNPEKAFQPYSWENFIAKLTTKTLS